MTDTATSSLPSDANNHALIPVPDTSKARGARRCWRAWALGLVLLGCGLAGTLWFVQQQLQTQRTEWSTQFAQTQSQAETSQAQLRRALDALQTHATRLTEQAAQLAQLQAEQARSNAQWQDLDQRLTFVTPVVPQEDSAWVLAEVARLVDIAQQSIQLQGEASTAFAALESAIAKLGQQPQWLALKTVLQQDIKRLQIAATADRADIAAQLAHLSTLLTQAPLLLPETPAALDLQAQTLAAPAPDLTQDANWWQHAWHVTRAWSRLAWHAVTQDLRSFIDVRRVDDATSLFMSPMQAAWLKETLQHHVVIAKLALMLRDPALWVTELDALHNALATRFDAQHSSTQAALTLVGTLRNTAIRVDLPSLDDSIQAIARQRTAHTQGSESPAAAPPDVERG